MKRLPCSYVSQYRCSFWQLFYIACYSQLFYKMDTIKILKKLVDKLEDLKDRPSDAFMNGYNNGLNQAILLLEEKIKQIEAVDE